MTEEFKTKMRAAGQLAAYTLNYACSLVKPGVSTEEIDRLINEYTLAHGAVSAPLNYRGFPKASCLSVNNIICHGVPNSYILQQGDSISVDVTVILDGHYGDTARTMIVGGEDTPLIICAREATAKAISLVAPGITMGDLGFCINKFISRRGFYIVESIGGHGIGTQFHMDPFTPSHGKKGKGFALKEGMCITIEPLVKDNNLEVEEVEVPGCPITQIKTAGKGAQFEHTVLVTATGHEILTIIK